MIAMRPPYELHNRISADVCFSLRHVWQELNQRESNRCPTGSARTEILCKMMIPFFSLAISDV